MTKVCHVVVLGQSGFIGGVVARRLAEDSFEVRAASSRECDLLNRAQVKSFLADLPNGSGVVFCSVINRGVDDSFKAFVRNTEMVQNFVSAVPPGRLTSVVYLSSVDVYGRTPPPPITERTMPNPASFYGNAKLTCEYLLRRPGALDCPVTVLRLPGVYGFGDRENSIVGRFLLLLQSKTPIILHGDGSVRRDYVEIGDVYRVIRHALENPFDGILNVATGRSCSMGELVTMLAQAVGVTPVIEHAPGDPNAAGNLIFDITALRAYLPDYDFKTLQQGSADYAAMLRHRKPLA